MTTRKKDEYEIEMKYLNRVCGKLLRLLGMPDRSKEASSFVEKFTKFFSLIVCYALITFFLVTTILYVIVMEKNIHVKLKKIPLVLYNVLVLIKYLCLIMKQKQIFRCMKCVEEDLKRIVNLYHRDIIVEKARYGKRFFAVICVFLHITVIFWRVYMPLVKGKIVTAENVTIRPLPSPGYYFHLFDDQVSPFYEIVFFLQCAEGCVTIYTNITICTLAVNFVMHACSQLEIFINLLEASVTSTEFTEKESVNEKLAVAIEHHTRIRNFLKNIESAMNPLYFVDIFGCSMTQCLLGYCLMMEWGQQSIKNVIPYIISISSLAVQIFVFCFVGEQLMLQEWTNRNFAIVFMYSIALSSIICNIFILCYIGEQLTLQAEKVARKSCTLDWYNLPAKKLSDLVLMIAISNRPMKITAGNIFGLSFQTFGNVIKTAATYCNMLRAVTS
uniref:odorant receptor 4-like isoform X2 n=1 Tax=Vespula vulgaris TaxID=7454 RepID=UPI00223AC2F7|nr:odorant receptor 4-like isoform X2 [Vespula vulgaris]